MVVDAPWTRMITDNSQIAIAKTYHKFRWYISSCPSTVGGKVRDRMHLCHAHSAQGWLAEEEDRSSKLRFGLIYHAGIGGNREEALNRNWVRIYEKIRQCN